MLYFKKDLRAYILAFILIATVAVSSYAQTSFTFVFSGLPNSSGLSYDWGDYNNDGYLDILVASSSPTVYLNDGYDYFTPQSGIILKSVFAGTGRWGDYDNDGDLDILLSGSNYGTYISVIYRNNGDNTFTEQTEISLKGFYNGDSDWGDYDNDGDLDILLCGSGFTKVYRNNGDNSFKALDGLNLLGLNYKASCHWGDFDNDGFLDILIAGSDGTRIYRNSGKDMFTELGGLTIPPVTQGDAKWFDFDNNGYLDVIFSGFSGGTPYTKIFLNDGNKTFTELPGLPFEDLFDSGLDGGDFDNDGDVDLLLSGALSANDKVTKIYRNNGDSTFTEESTYILYNASFGEVSWADIDSDGDLDVFIYGQDTAGLDSTKIYLNDIASPNASPSVPTGLQSWWKNDTLIFSWNKSTDATTSQNLLKYNLRVGTNPDGNEIRTAQTNYDGSLLTPQLATPIGDTSFHIKVAFNEFYWSVEAVDIGGAASGFALEETTPLDSIQSYNLEATAITNNSMVVRWEKGNGLRRVVFGRESSVSSPAEPVDGIIYHAEPSFGKGDKISGTTWYCLYDGIADSVVIHDLTNSQSYDIRVFEYILSGSSPIYFNTIGNANPGTFSASVLTEQTGINFSGFSGGSVEWGDYNNDGYLDILMSSPSYLTRIFRNNGDNTFTEENDIYLRETASYAAFGDYDNDNLLDVLASGIDYGGIYTSIFKNNGDVSFTEQVSFGLPGVTSSALAWCDYNSDSYLDLIITGTTGVEDISRIYMNNGDNTFTERTEIVLPGVKQGSVAWGDYDNDGDPDLLLAGLYNSTQTITKIFENKGDTIFAENTGIALLGINNGDVGWGDYNNDGFLDILLSGYSNGNGLKTKIYKNNGDKTFTELSSIGLDNLEESSVDWADYDKDGDLDILLTGSFGLGNTAKIYRNDGNDTFVEQTDIELTGVQSVSADWGDYDNDGDLDLLIDNKVYRNNTYMYAGTYLDNLKPDPPLNLSATPQPGLVHLSWDPVDTDETGSVSMSYNIRIGTKIDSFNLVSGNSDAYGERLIPEMGNAQLGTSFLVKNLQTGKYYWEVQAVDQGLKGSDWSVVDSFEVRNLEPFFTFDTVCWDLPTTFTDQTEASEVIDSWSWDFGDGQFSSQQNPSYTFATPGVHQVKLIVESAGAFDSISHDVLVLGEAINDFNFTTVCEGQQVTFTNTTATNGATIVDWQWDFGNSATSFDQNPVAQGYFYPGDYSVRLVTIADNGCSDTISKTVSVGAYPGPAISTNGSPEFCSGDSVILSNAYNPDFTYQWKVNGADISAADSSKYIARNSGDYTIEVINPIGNCLAESDPLTVTALAVPASPAISLTGSNSFCWGDSALLSVTNNVTYSYDWLLDGGYVGGTNKLTAFESGTYSLEVYSADYCMSTSSNTITLTVNNPPLDPDVKFFGGDVFCDGDSTILSVPYNTGLSYQWVKDGTNISTAIDTAYIVTKSGQYYLNVTNSNGCSTESLHEVITVMPTPGSPTIAISGNTTFCEGDSVKFSLTLNPAYEYFWILDGGDWDYNVAEFTAYDPGNYWVEVVNSDYCSAVSTNTINVNVKARPPEPFVEYFDSETCAGDSIILKVAKNSAFSYKWRKNGTAIAGATDTSYAAKSSGNYSVSVINVNGCATESYREPLTVYPTPAPPIIAVSDPTIFCVGDSAVLSVSASAGVQYFWLLDGEYISDNQNKLPAYFSGTYTVEAENSSFCTALSSNSISLTTNPLPPEPTIISEDPTQFCSDESAHLVSDITNPLLNYQWMNDATSIPSATTNDYYADRTGNYRLVVSNSFNCTSESQSIAINVNPAPSQPTIELSGSETFCQGDNVILTVPAEAGVQYKWLKYNGAVGLDQNSYTANTTGVYGLEVSNTNGCIIQATNTINVSVLPSPATPSISVEGGTSFCFGDSTKLRTIADGSLNYQWINGTTNIADANENIYFAKASGNYKIKVTNPEGCFNISGTESIDVAPAPLQPSISYVGDLNLCEGESLILNAVSNPEDVHQWLFNGGNIGSNSITLVAENEGIYSLRVTNNSSTCSIKSKNDVVISVADNPSTPAVVVGESTFCTGDSVQLKGVEDASLNFQWLKDANNIVDATTNILYAKSSGEFKLRVTNSDGCSEISPPNSVSFKEGPVPPRISYTGNIEFCKGDEIELSVPNVSEYNYTWFKNNSIALRDENIFVVDEEGDYKVSVSNSIGCEAFSTNTVQVQVHDYPLTPVISAGGATTFCEGLTVELSVSNDQSLSYQWKNGDTNIPDATSNILEASVSGSYKLSISNADGCSVETLAKDVVVNRYPIKPVIVTENYFEGECMDIESIAIGIEEVESDVNYKWLLGGEPIPGETSGNILGRIKEGNYKVEAENEGCIRVSETQNIQFAEMPPTPQIYAEGPTVWYLVCSDTTAQDINWFYNGDLIEDENDVIYVAGQQLGKYEVSVTYGGCYAISDALWIPLGTGVETNPWENLKLYPNPTPGMFTLEMDNPIMGELIIDIYNERGSKIINIKFQKETSHFVTKIDLSGQAPAPYYIGLILDRYQTTKTLIVE